ncbi:StAR-related lipid transfer protein 7 [Spatholobus suberectus]|nr:StAR-related lipid transfer protein 7 [Spatholobus suberectus]
MALPQSFYDMLENPAILGLCTVIGMFFSPLWVAFFVGVIVGWLWKPKWARLGKEKLTISLAKCLDFASPSSASSPSKSVVSPMKSCSSSPCLNSIKMYPPNPESLLLKKGMDKKPSSSSSPVKRASSSSEEISDAVTIADLHHLWLLVEEKDGGLPWIQMMDRCTPTMSYKAWRREPKDGPPQYRSSTVFEDATPEIVRDLFWDDEFRPRWDDMLASSSTIEECPATGTMKVQWIRKFPFFCKDREYIIGRRIWESGRHYYCVTKGVDCPSLPKRDKPRRVDVYYSSWCIRAVESRRGNGQLTACEVLLFHHEEMGIPWEIAKLGVKKGMWGTVQKIEPGLRAYQEARASGAALSRSAFMAQVNTKISPEYLQSIGADDNSAENESVVASDKPQGVNIPKMLVIGGAIALACSLDRGLVTKYVLFGVARRFANMGKR